MSLRFLAAVALLVLALSAAGAQDVDGFAARSFKGANGVTMLYRLFIPSAEPRKKALPLVVYLHGAGGRRGSDVGVCIMPRHGLSATLLCSSATSPPRGFRLQAESVRWVLPPKGGSHAAWRKPRTAVWRCRCDMPKCPPPSPEYVPFNAVEMSSPSPGVSSIAKESAATRPHSACTPDRHPPTHRS